MFFAKKHEKYQSGRDTFLKLEYNYWGFCLAQSGKCPFEGSVHFCRGSCLDVPSTQDRDAQQLMTLPVLSNFSPGIGLVNFVYVLRY